MIISMLIHHVALYQSKVPLSVCSVTTMSADCTLTCKRLNILSVVLVSHSELYVVDQWHDRVENWTDHMSVKHQKSKHFTESQCKVMNTVMQRQIQYVLKSNDLNLVWDSFGFVIHGAPPTVWNGVIINCLPINLIKNVITSLSIWRLLQSSWLTLLTTTK